MNGLADLHTHTHASDGTTSPAENVRLALEAGLRAVAVTDHDTTAGIAEAAAEGEKLGIAVVPGIELSTFLNGVSIHILGYYIRPDDPLFLERLGQLRAARSRRNEQIVRNLAKLGIAVTMEDVLLAAGKREGRSVGRPHIADALVDKGYADDRRDAFARYIGEGAPAYAAVPRISPQEAIRWIHDAGGAAVLAHPGLYRDDRLVERVLDDGADGIEAFHSDHRAEDAERYVRLARNRGLIVTGGSDFHGFHGTEASRGRIGERTVDCGVLEVLKKAGGGVK